MKKIYLSLVALLAMAASALAQKTVDIQVILNAPSANTVVNCNDSFPISYSFVNHGPDKLVTGDSLNFKDPEAEEQSGWYTVLENDFNMGDTILIYEGNTHMNITKTLYNEAGDTMLVGPFANGKYIYYALSYTDSSVYIDPVMTNNISGAIIEVNCQTSTDDITKGTALNVFPNPAQNEMNFTFDITTANNATVRIMDLMGRTLVTKDFGKQAVGTNNFTLDVTTLSNGVYYVELASGDIRGISKFTVSK
jgi:hypothetical protein